MNNNNFLFNATSLKKSNINIDKQYALIAFEGKKSASLIEVSCNLNLNKIHWPQLADIETGKRLCINVVDWIDAFLLIKHLMTLTEVADA